MENIPTVEPREAFGDEEYKCVLDCINYYRSKRIDPPYDGFYQKEYERLISTKLNGGYSIAVNSGSAASYIAIKSLELGKNSEVLMSPVTDTSSFLSIVMAELRPKILDTTKYTYNTSLEEIKKSVSKKTKAVYLVHTYGSVADIVRVREYCNYKNIKLIEDCSQAPFAFVMDKGKKRFVGEYGDISCFSTMYRKTLNTSSSGGIVFTKDEALHRIATEYADRGRKKWNKSADARDGGDIERFSLNFNSNELSCAIGIASLQRLDTTIAKRRQLLDHIIKNTQKYHEYLKVMEFPSGSYPFLVPIIFTDKGLEYRERLFEILDANKIPYAREYPCFAHDWKCVKDYFSRNKVFNFLNNNRRDVNSMNATKLKSRAFNLYLHEGYSYKYVNFMLGLFSILP